MKKLALFLTLVILVGACIECFSAVAEEASEPVKLVYYYKAVSDATEQSDPEMLKAVHDVIMEETGVDLEIIIGPQIDQDDTTKLNLLLSSNQQVGNFYLFMVAAVCKGLSCGPDGLYSQGPGGAGSAVDDAPGNK